MIEHTDSPSCQCWACGKADRDEIARALQAKDCCASCRFWGGPAPRDVHERSGCQRHAPTRLGTETMNRGDRWPQTYAGEWCGDYERRETEGAWA